MRISYQYLSIVAVERRIIITFYKGLETVLSVKFCKGWNVNGSLVLHYGKFVWNLLIFPSSRSNVCFVIESRYNGNGNEGNIEINLHYIISFCIETEKFSW